MRSKEDNVLKKIATYRKRWRKQCKYNGRRQVAEDSMRLYTVSTARIFRRKSSDVRSRILKRRVSLYCRFMKIRTIPMLYSLMRSWAGT
jgi:hypothetical protein